MNNPICFALDGMGEELAKQFIHSLEPHVGAFKVGLELFIRSGKLPKTSLPLILDLKLHDIPETVAHAVKAGAELGAKYMTVHIQQRKALEMALQVAEVYGVTLLGVTVLTSMDHIDFENLRFLKQTPAERADNLAFFGASCGMKGFVCSPQEVKAIRTRFPEAFLLVPGVRPAGANVQDQKRTGTPRQAVHDGASMLVIGRPIRDAENPAKAAQDILAIIQAEI